MADIGTPGSSQPILIIDDSDDDFDATKRALNKDGNIRNPLYRCEDGREALDYLMQQGRYAEPETAPRPGIIFLDLNMPGMDGRQFLAEVKGVNSLKRIPVVVMTTSNSQDDIDYCYDVGGNTYVQKPFDWTAFCEAVQRLKDHWLEIAVLPRA